MKAGWRLAVMVSLAVYLLGLSFIALTPPWEGYDETAHYSFAQQLADTQKAPSFASGRISRDVEEYQAAMPMPYRPVPAFDDNGGLTYRQWFSGSPSGARSAHDLPPSARLFAPGQAPNWQAQHPPLYYRVMAPLVGWTADLSWAAQLFWLRLVSWSMAFAGLLIGVAATMRGLQTLAPQLVGDYAWVVSCWVLLFPGLLPEFARLGNDALVVLLFGLVWAWAVKRVITPVSWWWYAGLGVLLGVGGLTKVIFLPVTLVMLGWLAWMGLNAEDPRERIRTWFGGLIAAGLVVSIASRGYLANIAERGSLTGLEELAHRDEVASPFWLAGFEHPLMLVKGLLNMGLTFIWGGTASSAYPPVTLMLPLWGMTMVLAAASLLRVRGRDPLAMLAAGLVGGVLISLLYYLLARLADEKVGAGTPGWYLHIFAAPLSLLFALGANELKQRWVFCVTLGRIWLGYAVCLFAAITWLQLALFTGCTFKTATSRMYASEDWRCLADIGALYRGLERLAFPAAGLTCFAVALVLIGFAGLRWRGVFEVSSPR
ncbi:Predicted membrane protein [Paucimonas lemoignei]|nr:Predicted membrane protein [Paucimonas lemoignei]